ncbi:MAG: hypothetical protein AAFQ43_14375, partial [Bacteroidota bacterium]
MTETASAPPSRRRRAAVFALVALGIAALIPITWGIEAAVVARSGGEVAAREAQRATVRAVQQRMTDLVAQMQREGEAIAVDPAVRGALRAVSTSPEASGDAIGSLLGRDLPPLTSVEIVAPGLETVAWRGSTFRWGVRRTPSAPLSIAIGDEAGRRALIVWVPVMEGGESLGAVRVVRLAQAAVPVRNRFLQDYDIADDWRDGIDGSFELLVASRRVAPSPEAQRVTGIEGRTIGWVRAATPTGAALTGSLRDRFQAARTFWAVLLLGWGLAGLVGLYVLVLRRAARLNTRRCWAEAAGVFVGLASALVATRFALLRLDVPVRWLDAGRETPELFDPLVLASEVGW